MDRIRSAITLCALVCAGALQAQSLPRDLDTFIEQVRRDWNVAGLAVSVVKDGEVVYAKGFGVRQEGKSELVNEHTLFAIGSNSKSFTAAGVGILVDEGKLTWDDKVVEHLPQFQLYDPWVTREFMVRDLMSHRSGLGRRGDGNWYGTDFDRDEVLRRIRYLEPNSSFRAQYGYQNTMFLAAGEVMEAAAGMTWDDWITSRIFRPLGMTRSRTSTRQLAAVDNVANPHALEDGKAVPIPHRNLDNVAPAGSIYSSVQEMSYWLRMMLNDGEFNGKRVVSKDVVREVWTPHTITGRPNAEMQELYTGTHFLTYGLGWGLRDYRGRLVAGHTGGIDGMLSRMTVLPEEELGIMVVTNTSPNNAHTPITYHIVDAYLGAGGERDWNATLLAQAKEQREQARVAREKRLASRTQGTSPSLPLDGYAGTYEDDMYGEATIRYENGGLVMRRHSEFVGDLEHWHYDTFQVKWRSGRRGEAMVTFALNARGEVESMEVQGLAEFHKKSEPVQAGSEN